MVTAQNRWPDVEHALAYLAKADTIPHRYIFTLFALDVEKCPVQRKFRAADIVKAIKGHVLGSAQLTGRYSLNPDVEA